MTEADIVERLREKRGILDNRWPGPTALELEAAGEIERLRAALAPHDDKAALSRTNAPPVIDLADRESPP